MALTKQEQKEFQSLYGFSPKTKGKTTTAKTTTNLSEQEKEEFKTLYGFEPGAKTAIPKPTVTSTKTQPKQTTGLFSKQDPQIVLNTIKGMIPGADWIFKEPSGNVGEELGGYAKAVGGGAADIVKGIAGIPVRLGLTISDLLGGPKKLNVPVIGEQQSPQETYRGLKEAGAGTVVSAGLPIAQTIMDLLIGKGAVKSTIKGFKGKPAEVKVPEVKPVEQKLLPVPQKKAIELPATVEEARQMKPIPAPVEQPNVEILPAKQGKPVIPKPNETDALQPMLDKLVRPEAKPKTGIKGKIEVLKDLNPYRFESGRIEAMGPAGKEIVTRARRVNNTAIITAGDIRKQITNTRITEFTEPELTNFRQVLENKSLPLNSKVASAANSWRELFNKYGKETEVSMIENYFPRRPNEAGIKFYQDARNKEVLINEVMKQQGLDRLNAIKFVDKSLRRGSFEFERVLPELPDQYRLSPLDEIYQWSADVSRRKGIINEFGKKNEIVDELLAKVGQGDKNEFRLKSRAQDYVNRVMGKTNEFSELDPIYNALREVMVISKLNPITTVANELQGHINSWLQYGAKGLKDATFGRGGKKLVEELGLKDLGTKFGQEVPVESWASKWLSRIGMQKSEIRGFSRTAVSTERAILDAFNRLKANPTDVAAKKFLNDHAMYLDDKTLARDLMAGKPSEMELKLGTVEGVRQKMFFNTPGERPAWANAGAGRVAYTFKNYIFNQMQLLMKAPPERQLAYMMVIAPLTGLPIMTLRKILQGKPLPDNLADWYVEAATAGPGTPFDILRSLDINPVGLVAGGFNPLLDIATSRNKLKSVVSNLPLQSFYLNRLFPPKK